MVDSAQGRGANTRPIPLEIKLKQRSRKLAIRFNDGACFELSCEFLRVYSPSADVKGHSGQDRVLQVGKEAVNITAIEPVGNYAVKLVFDDGHSTGLYSWDYLHDLGVNQNRYWVDYLDALKQASHLRRPIA
ncbi:MAG: gamma-butyrobetaine hydroxylase-like domain-containing protein [Gammaproteobacteria bacterium]